MYRFFRFDIPSKSLDLLGISFPFSPNTGKYGPEETPYLDTFHAVIVNFTFSKTWYSGYKCVIATWYSVPILHQRNSSILECHIRAVYFFVCFGAISIFQICYEFY